MPTPPRRCLAFRLRTVIAVAAGATLLPWLAAKGLSLGMLAVAFMVVVAIAFWCACACILLAMAICRISHLKFRLRTLFVVVAVVAVPMAWVSYARNWIWHRDRIAGQWRFMVYTARLKSPGGLWLLGDRGVVSLAWSKDNAYGYSMEDYRRYCPEAQVYEGHYTGCLEPGPIGGARQP